MLSEPSVMPFTRVERERTHRVRTVVIDDSASFLEVVCALLECSEDLDVVARGRDGAEAIDLVQKLHPDLLVMDVDMPRLDGLNAALVISAKFPSVRIVLMSAEDSRELQADCMACGAAAFVSKARLRQEFPFCLQSMVIQQLSHRRLHQM